MNTAKSGEHRLLRIVSKLLKIGSVLIGLASVIFIILSLLDPSFLFIVLFYPQFLSQWAASGFPQQVYNSGSSNLYNQAITAGVLPESIAVLVGAIFLYAISQAFDAILATEEQAQHNNDLLRVLLEKVSTRG